MGNCFAKNKLPGCFKLREDQGTVFFYQRNPIFSHYINFVALIPQRAHLGLSWPWLRGQGLVLGLLSHHCQGLEARGGLLGQGHPHPPPHARQRPTTKGSSFPWKRGLQEAAAAGGPQPRCSRVGQLLVGTDGEVEELDHINLFSFYPSSVCVFFLSPPTPRNIMVSETLSGGHFRRCNIFMSCDALSSLDLGHFVPTVHSPT